MHMRAFLLACCVLCADALVAQEVQLDTLGGDTWTFTPQVSGSIANGVCEQIVLRSPAGSVSALVIERRFTATVPLLPGENEIAVVVRGTLAGYLDDASPTAGVYAGQVRTGLLGPVVLRRHGGSG
jgi:hypothetical protein